MSDGIDPVQFGNMQSDVAHTKESVGRIETLIEKHIEEDYQSKTLLKKRMQDIEDKQLIEETKNKTFKKYAIGTASIYAGVKSVFAFFGV